MWPSHLKLQYMTFWFSVWALFKPLSFCALQFNTQVVSVIPVLGEGKNSQVSWDVTFQTQDHGDLVTERFDAIMVCVG